MTNEQIDACTKIADLVKLAGGSEDKIVSAAKFGLKSSVRSKNDRTLLTQAKALLAAGKITLK